MNKTEREFTIQDVMPVAVIFVVAAITIGYGASVLSSVQATQTANSYAYNATGYGLQSVNTVASNLPLIATIIVAAIIIGILVTYLIVRFR